MAVVLLGVPPESQDRLTNRYGGRCFFFVDVPDRLPVVGEPFGN
jgi:hypothetical protein